MSDARPWLSVIMPTHQGERWIGAALASLADEADDGLELLVVDSSPDGATLDVVRAFEDRLDIHILDCGSDRMWHAKTNRAAAAARADHLCWLHQDDLWLPGRGAAVRRWIEAHPDAVLHLSGSLIVDAEGRERGRWRCPLRGDGAVDGQLLLERLLVQNFVAVPAPVMRREAFLACGGLDESLWYTADWDLWLKLAGAGRVCHHPEITAGFRVHGGSLTVSGSHDAAGFARQMQIVRDRHLPRLNGRCPAVARASATSIRVNSALAAASGGEWRALLPAAAQVVRLGPLGIRRYMRDSRIVERALPRLRARRAGVF